MIDQPTALREGESLDLEKLKTHLIAIDDRWKGEYSLKQFPSGFSNLTFFLQIDDQGYVLRRPPYGASAKGGHDMFREYRVMRDLKGQFSRVPEVYHYSEDTSVMGCPFYLMERVEGVILRSPNHPAALKLESDAYQQLSSTWMDVLVELHAVDYEAAGLGDFGRPEGYVERQIKGWSKRYVKAKTSEVKAIEKVMAWLNDQPLKNYAVSLIHNDYKYDNVVFTPENWGEIKAVLDWEMATVGDPIMDLGSSLAYWVNPEDMPMEKQQAMLPTHFEGNPIRGEVVHQYSLKSGREVGDFVFPYVYGLFKLSVVVQQIFYRYKMGHTQDKRFQHLNMIAEMLCMKAQQAIDRKRIDSLYG